MSKSKNTMSKENSPFVFLKSTLTALNQNKELYYPFIIIVFINFLVLEILYFAPRGPLSTFFGPIIQRVWGENFLHYPADLILLPKMFYYAQIFIYLFIGSLLMAVSVHMLAAFNNEQRVNFKLSLRKCLPKYIYFLIIGLISLGLYQLFNTVYGLMIARAYKIHSTTGIFGLIKKAVILGAPYVQFIVGIVFTMLLLYVVPLIVIEQKKLFKAIVENFIFMFKSFWNSFIFVLIPTLFYIPILLMRDNIAFLAKVAFPEVQVIVLSLGILVTTAINIFVLLVASVYLMYKKENT